MKIEGSNALITGASSGIGKAIAETLHKGGARVWGTSRNPDELEWPPGIQPLKLNIESPELIEEAWDSQGLEQLGFNIVVNNAGYGVFGRFSESLFEDWERQVSTMLIGTMKLCRLALPGLIERKGCLVNVSSIAVDFPVPYMSGYNAAKAGLSGFTESLIIETSASGMLAIDFRPGDIKTSFNRNMLKKIGKNANEGCVDKVWKRIEERISKSPEPIVAAEKLVRCIQQNQSGTIRAGTFFQSFLAPLLSRLATKNLARAGNVAYYTK